MANYVIVGTVYSEFRTILSTDPNVNDLQDGSEISSGVTVEALDLGNNLLASTESNLKGKFILRFQIPAGGPQAVTLNFSRNITFLTPPPQHQLLLRITPGRNRVTEGDALIPY